MNLRLRRCAALIAGGALVAGTAAAIPPAPAQAVTNDPSVDSAIRWLDEQRAAGQVSPGTLADAYYGLQDVGADQKLIDQVADDVIASVPGYYETDYEYPAGSHYTGISAGGVAKALAVAVDSGADPTDVNGEDLEAELEARIITDGPSTGRIADLSYLNAAPDTTDYANSIGQVYAVRGLAGADSEWEDEALDFLLAQQCDSGFFRLYFEYDKSAADQSCPAGADVEQADTTALVLVLLDDLALPGSPLADALDEAEAWLLTQQAEDGTFPATEGFNANTTGLAGWALGIRGEADAAAAAGDAVRARQLTGAACDGAARGEGGALAFTDASLTDGLEFGIDDVRWEWVGATAQAFPALHYASDTTPDQGLGLRVPRFAQLGKKVVVKAQRIEPGQRACLVFAGQRIDLVGDGGTQTVALDAPEDEKLYRVALHVAGSSAFSPVDVLGPQRLKLTYKKVVKRGSKISVRVERLAAYESVTVKIGKKKFTGEANRIGLFGVQKKVGRKGGKITVVGEYRNRRATGKFRVR